MTTNALILVGIFLIGIDLKRRFALARNAAPSKVKIVEIAGASVLKTLLEIGMFVVIKFDIEHALFNNPAGLPLSHGQMFVEGVLLSALCIIYSKYLPFSRWAEHLVYKCFILANRLGWRKAEAQKEIAILKLALKCLESVVSPEDPIEIQFQLTIPRWYLNRAESAASLHDWSRALLCAENGNNQCFRRLTQELL